jgi:hypothetical protein
LKERDGAASAIESIETIKGKLETIEGELVQTEFTSDGDTLNYRQKLFELLSGLPAVVSSADARPTVQSYAVYDKLAGQADAQLAALQAVIDGDVARLNGQLAGLGVSIVGA